MLLFVLTPSLSCYAQSTKLAWDFCLTNACNFNIRTRLVFLSETSAFINFQPLLWLMRRNCRITIIWKIELSREVFFSSQITNKETFQESFVSTRKVSTFYLLRRFDVDEFMSLTSQETWALWLLFDEFFNKCEFS